MTAVPSSPVLRISSDEFLCALRRRLGLCVDCDAGHCEGCGRGLDAHGFHRTTCTRTGRNHARHRGVVDAWRQVFQEAGGHVPDRNVERLLRATHVPVDPSDNRRLDLVVTGLSVARGLPLFCDATCVSPITGAGAARSGCTMIDGSVLAAARRDNQRTYREVTETGLGHLCCLGSETYGRWGSDALDVVTRMVAERCRGLPSSVRLGLQVALSRRWWGILSVAVQREVARAILRGTGADLVDHALEPPPQLGDLPAI